MQQKRVCVYKKCGPAANTHIAY